MIARPREDLFKKARNPSVSSLLSGFWILDFKILGLEGENKIGTPLKIRKGKEEQIQGMRMEDKDKRTTAACQKREIEGKVRAAVLSLTVHLWSSSLKLRASVHSLFAAHFQILFNPDYKDKIAARENKIHKRRK